MANCSKHVVPPQSTHGQATSTAGCAVPAGLETFIGLLQPKTSRAFTTKSHSNTYKNYVNDGHHSKAVNSRFTDGATCQLTFVNNTTNTPDSNANEDEQITHSCYATLTLTIILAYDAPQSVERHSNMTSSKSNSNCSSPSKRPLSVDSENTVTSSCRMIEMPTAIFIQRIVISDY